MERNNNTDIKDVRKLNESEKMTQVFSGRHSLTILLLVISGFMVFWFLLSGAMSDNRFGTHLVMSADLTSIPAWYGLSILFIAASLTGVGFILFFLFYRDRINLTESQEKTLRVGSLFMMGTSAFYIALSSITFAAFNNEFFISVLVDKQFHWDSLAPIITPFGKFSSSTYYSLQGVVIAIMSIITFAIIMAITAFIFFAKVEVSNKFYYSGRNSAVLLIAIGWLTFNINITAFGTMGGDASVLVNAILGEFGYEINFNQLGEITSQLTIMLQNLSEMTSNESWKKLEPIFSKILDEKLLFALHAAWLPLWTGILSPLSFALNDLINEISVMISPVSAWMAGMSKESFIQGVNESAAAYILFTIFILATLASPMYVILTYFTFKDNKISIFYDWSIYTTLGVTIIYGILAWTIPYISVSNVENYRPIIDGFIQGDANGLAPGLIGQTGQPGGINGALVYFSPNYHGTIAWWIGFALVFLTPAITMWLAIWKNFDDVKHNFKISKKLRYFYKTI